MIFRHESEAGDLFSFLQRSGFLLHLPEQAAIDALIDDGVDWHYISPKHKFQVYAFHSHCSLLIEIYLQQSLPPYGADKVPMLFPEDRCQPFLEFEVEMIDMKKDEGSRNIPGESLDILEKVDDALLSSTRARIKKIYDEHFGAAGNECPLVAAVVNDNDAMMACGKNARMGCYLCTISKDRSMGNLINNTHPEYEKYYQFRSILKAIAQDIRYGGMTGFQRFGGSIASTKPGKLGNGIGDLTIDCRTHLLQSMKRLDIEWRESEILTAYQMVLQRESVEGFPLTDRFREAIFALLNIHNTGFRRMLCDPIFDPFGTGIDQFTSEDEEAIQRIMAQGSRETSFAN